MPTHSPIDEAPVPTMTFGSRGEDIGYRLGARELWITFTYLRGPRIYTDTIEHWTDGTRLTDEEKQRVLVDVIRFVGARGVTPIVVINDNDPARALWARVSSANPQLPHEVDRSSDAAQLQPERYMYLQMLKSGAEVAIDGSPIRSEEELDRALQAIRPRRSS